MVAGKGIGSVAAGLAVLLALSGVAAQSKPAAAEAGAETAQNVKLTVRLGQLADGKRADVKSYDVVLISGGAGTRLLSGARVPLPGARTEDGGSGAIVYQNIGFTTEAWAWVLADGRIKVAATIEDSRLVRAEGAGSAPSVETRQVSVNAILEPGKPLEVARNNGIRDGSGFIEIEAQVLR